MIVINREKAEASVLDRIRIERDSRLVELDIRFMRAIESGEDAASITAEKQALRNVTQKDLSSLSLEDLAQLTIDQALAI